MALYTLYTDSCQLQPSWLTGLDFGNQQQPRPSGIWDQRHAPDHDDVLLTSESIKEFPLVSKCCTGLHRDENWQGLVALLAEYSTQLGEHHLSVSQTKKLWFSLVSIECRLRAILKATAVAQTTCTWKWIQDKHSALLEYLSKARNPYNWHKNCNNITYSLDFVDQIHTMMARTPLHCDFSLAGLGDKLGACSCNQNGPVLSCLVDNCWLTDFSDLAHVDTDSARKKVMVPFVHPEEEVAIENVNVDLTFLNESSPGDFTRYSLTYNPCTRQYEPILAPPPTTTEETAASAPKKPSHKRRQRGCRGKGNKPPKTAAVK